MTHDYSLGCHTHMRRLCKAHLKIMNSASVNMK